MSALEAMIAAAYAGVIGIEALIIVLAVQFLRRIWLPEYREQMRMRRFTEAQIRAAVERCNRQECDL